MKKLILLLAAFSIGFASCKKDDPKPKPLTQKEIQDLYKKKQIM